MNIEQQEGSCSHILVSLGSKEIFGDYERCLLCGKQAPEVYSLASELLCWYKRLFIEL